MGDGAAEDPGSSPAEEAGAARGTTWSGRLVELVVIVVGILVALGAQALWEYSVERREEREALVALRAEFLESRQNLESARRIHENYAAATATLLQWTGPNPRLPGGDTAAAELNRATLTYSTFNDRNGVLDGVIASGGLRLIRNDALRSMLAGWPAVVEDFTEDEVLAIEFRNREFLPYIYRYVPVDGSRFPRDLRPLFADPYFERLLDWRRRQVVSGILPPYNTAAEALADIIAAIDAELGGR